MLRELLEDCEKSFAEVVIMLANPGTTAEVYMNFDDLRFTEDGKTMTVMDEGGTHIHLHMDLVTGARLVQTTNDRGLPSYQLWLLDSQEEALMRVYLRKSENEATNQPRHDHFMGLIEKYGETVSLTG